MPAPAPAPERSWSRLALIHSIEEIQVRRAALHVARLVVCCASGPTQALASPASEHTAPAAIYTFAQEDFVTFRAAQPAKPDPEPEPEPIWGTIVVLGGPSGPLYLEVERST